MASAPAILDRDGIAIAYHHTPARGAGARLPGVVFLGGFMSDMEGGKALHLEATCRERGQNTPGWTIAAMANPAAYSLRPASPTGPATPQP